MRLTRVTGLSWAVLALLLAGIGLYTTQLSGPRAPQALIAGADAGSGCGAAVLPAWNDDPGDDGGWGLAPRPALRAGGREASVAETRSQGLRALTASDTKGRQLMLALINTGRFYAFYTNAPIPEDATLDHVMAAKGIYTYEAPNPGVDTGRAAMRSLGDLAAGIRIGPCLASFGHASPFTGGIRPYVIYWSDDRNSFMVMGNVDDPRNLIEFARSMVCES